jgi:hypothetical protein
VQSRERGRGNDEIGKGAADCRVETDGLIRHLTGFIGVLYSPIVAGPTTGSAYCGK